MRLHSVKIVPDIKFITGSHAVPMNLYNASPSLVFLKVRLGWVASKGRRMFKTEARGIYSTALTGLLIEHDFEIVRPSERITERFGLDTSEDKPDLVIRDRFDRQGVESTGDAESVEALGRVLRGELFDVILRRKVEGRCLEVEFPWASKTKLDEYRRNVVPTVRMHHYYKACGGEVSSAADMAERLLTKGRRAEEVEELLRRTLTLYFPLEGSEIGIEHAKIHGGFLNLGKAVIEDNAENSMMKYSREMRGGGLYDGLGTEKEAGDVAITEARMGEYHTVTRYLSRGGRFKGAYININTPIELYPTKIRYVDLEVDICIRPGRDAEVVDEALIEKAASEGFITDKLLDVVKAEKNELMARIPDILPD